MGIKWIYEEELLNDIKLLVNYYQRNIWWWWLEDFSLYAKNMAYRKKYLKNWMSNQSVWLIAKTVDSTYAHLQDNLIRFYIFGASDSKEDKMKAKMVESEVIWNYQTSMSKKDLNMALSDAINCWEWYLKINYDSSSQEVEFYKNITLKNWKKTSKKIKKKFGVREFTRLVYKTPFSVMMDVAAKRPDNVRRIVERNIMSKKDIIKNYWFFISDDDWNIKINDEEFEELTKSSNIILNYDYDYIKTSILLWANIDYFNFISSDAKTLDDINTNYSFNKNKMYEVIEIREDDNFKLLINWYIYYDDINPYPIKDLPYTQICYNLVNWTIRGIWIPRMLKWLEYVGNALLNSYIDEVRLKSVPVFQKVIWTSQVKDINSVVDLMPWEVIPVDMPNAITPLQLGGSNMNVVELLNYLDSLAFQIVWLNEIVLGGSISQGKVLRSASDVIQRVNWFKVRMLPLFDSMNYALSKYAKFTILFTAMYMDKNIQRRIFEEWKYYLSETDINALMNDWDVVIDTSALQTAMKEVRIQQMLQFLQTANSFATDPITWLPKLDTNELLWEMADLLDVSDDFILDDKSAQKKVVNWEKIKAELQKKIAARQQELQANNEPWAEDMLNTLWNELNNTNVNTNANMPNVEVPPTVTEQYWDILSSALSNPKKSV